MGLYHAKYIKQMLTILRFQVRKAIKDINQSPTADADLYNPITAEECKIALL